MRKLILFLWIYIFALAPSLMAQNDIKTMNKVVIDPTIQQEILLGPCNIDGLKSSTVFKQYYDAALCSTQRPKAELLDVKSQLQSMDITILFGSWCSDSQTLVPELLILLDSLEFPSNKLTILAVDRKKQIPTMDIQQYDLQLVPTILFYSEGIEIDRIVEIPMESLEKDLLEIIKSIE